MIERRKLSRDTHPTNADAKAIKKPLQGLAFLASMLNRLPSLGAFSLIANCVRTSGRVIQRNDNPEPHRKPLSATIETVRRL